MEITEVKIFPVQEEKLRAFVAIVLDDCFMVNDIKIIQGREGLFISMPSRRKRNGDFKDIAHPLNNTTRRWIEDRILSEYDDAILGRQGSRKADSRRPLAETMVAARSEAKEAPEQPSTESGEELPDSLEEVEKRHLSDSFWNVG